MPRREFINDGAHRAFTLVELLVVLAIIGILMALILPAVQAAREAARKVACRTNLKQLGLAAQVHHDTYRHLPTNGWGHAWVGDPDRGLDRRQPGGWAYNLLPFVEQSALRELGAGQPAPAKRAELARLLQSPASVFVCPSRRAASPHPYTGHALLRNVDNPTVAAKTDYAVNVGDTPVNTGPGPDSFSPSDLQSYAWPNTSGITGVCFVASQLNLAAVTDGTSHTYLIGEKYINAAAYATGGDGGDDQTLFLGDDADIRRWTREPPQRDTQRVASKEIFGGLHPGACLFVFCDGSVRDIAYEIDPAAHRRLGNRRDGQPVGLP